MHSQVDLCVHLEMLDKIKPVGNDGDSGFLNIKSLVQMPKCGFRNITSGSTLMLKISAVLK